MGKVPETKGKSLEQIQEAWAKHDEMQKRGEGLQRSTSIWIDVDKRREG